jgi:hypothetical protein
VLDTLGIAEGVIELVLDALGIAEGVLGLVLVVLGVADALLVPTLVMLGVAEGVLGLTLVMPVVADGAVGPGTAVEAEAGVGRGLVLSEQALPTSESVVSESTCRMAAMKMLAT